jgi:hypothetical protein
MQITRKTIAEHLGDYLQGTITLAQLVDWAEQAVCEGDFDEQESGALTKIVARLGLADVRAFGLTWEDYRNIFEALGVSAKVDLVAA